MLNKPEFRGEEYARTFQDASVVQVYHARPPYPDEVYDKLAELIDPEVDALLDVGTGLGDIARPMAERVARVDAVDFSERMIARARTLAGGDHPGITWVASHIETAPVTGPYGLITAGACLHWFDLNLVMPRFADLLSPEGYLAIVERDWVTGIKDNEFIAEYSTNQKYFPWNHVQAVQEADLFERVGEVDLGSTAWCPTVEVYLECRHSQNGLSRDRMGEERANAFDDLVRDRIEKQAAEGTVNLIDGRIQGRCTSDIVWGKPNPAGRLTSVEGTG